MGVTQYIGARYVPYIFGEWQSNRTYEPLTIVTYNNGSYTSRKKVPINVAPTNSEYWAFTGNYNAQVEQYREEVQQLSEQVSNIGDEVEDALEEFSTSFYPNKLSGVKVLTVSNSFGAGTGSTNSRGWVYYFRQNTGAIGDSINQNGGDFTRDGNSNASYPNKTYVEAISTWALSKTSDELMEYRYVFFVGGHNDHGESYATVRNAVQTCIETTKTLLPNAKIIVIPTIASHIFNSDFMHMMRGWFEGAVNCGCCSTANSYLWFYGIEDLNNADGIHLNNDGYARLARYVEAVFNGWDGVLKSIGDNWTAETVEGMTINSASYLKTGDICSFKLRVTFAANSIGTARIKIGNIGPRFRTGGTALYIPATLYTFVNNDRRTVFIEITSTGDVTLLETEAVAADTEYQLLFYTTYTIGY